MKNILVVGGVKELHSKLKKRDVKYTLLISKQDYDVNFFSRAEKVLLFDFSKKESIINTIMALHNLDPFVAVVCIAEKDQPIAFEISEAIGLFNNSSLAPYLTINKHLLRELLEKKNISNLNYKVCIDADHLRFSG